MITSTREVRPELEGTSQPAGYHFDFVQWTRDHSHLFPTPTAEEATFVGQIFQIRHFQQLIEKKKLLKGGFNADPFLVARAAVLRATLVTMESKPPNGAKIPNVCERFGIECINVSMFMEREDWVF